MFFGWDTDPARSRVGCTGDVRFFALGQGLFLAQNGPWAVISHLRDDPIRTLRYQRFVYWAVVSAYTDISVRASAIIFLQVYCSCRCHLGCPFATSGSVEGQLSDSLVGLSASSAYRFSALRVRPYGSATEEVASVSRLQVALFGRAAAVFRCPQLGGYCCKSLFGGTNEIS